ncbi:MAG: hypothetical protein WCF04_09045, partial [Candidatus Nanopelagicales bacterium]
ALLSATSKHERSKDASGGLLRLLEPRGVMVVKDVTSILSMDRNMRAEVLGALREIHDGAWDRNVGTDGGRTLSWRGRIAILGAVTTAWDTAHAVIATMGDRFVLLRMDSTTGRAEAGRRAIGNTGDETRMRDELRAAAAGVIAGMNPCPGHVNESELDALLAAADLVTRGRTGVEFDYQGDVIDSHAPEMPTRFAKELTQILRGGLAIGMPRADAFRLAIRVARDSMPPLRLAIVDDLAEHPESTTYEVRRRIGKPRKTVDRQLQALHMLGVVEVDEEESEHFGRAVTRWRYRLASWVDPSCLRRETRARNVVNPPYSPRRERGEVEEGTEETAEETGRLYIPSNKSGPCLDLGDAGTTGATGALFGPCVRCATLTRRYGPAGNPLCDDCRASQTGEPA